MPIRPYLKDSSFDPDQITAMSAALEEASRMLEANPRPGLMTDVVARKIVEEHATVPAQEYEKPRRIFPLSLLPSRPAPTMPPPDLASIIGFAGLWLMVLGVLFTCLGILLARPTCQ